MTTPMRTLRLRSRKRSMRMHLRSPLPRPPWLRPQSPRRKAKQRRLRTMRVMMQLLLRLCQLPQLRPLHRPRRRRSRRRLSTMIPAMIPATLLHRWCTTRLLRRRRQWRTTAPMILATPQHQCIRLRPRRLLQLPLTPTPRTRHPSPSRRPRKRHLRPPLTTMIHWMMPLQPRLRRRTRSTGSRLQRRRPTTLASPWTRPQIRPQQPRPWWPPLTRRTRRSITTRTTTTSSWMASLIRLQGPCLLRTRLGVRMTSLQQRRPSRQLMPTRWPSTTQTALRLRHRRRHTRSTTAQQRWPLLTTATLTRRPRQRLLRLLPRPRPPSRRRPMRPRTTTALLLLRSTTDTTRTRTLRPPRRHLWSKPRPRRLRTWRRPSPVRTATSMASITISQPTMISWTGSSIPHPGRCQPLTRHGDPMAPVELLPPHQSLHCRWLRMSLVSTCQQRASPNSRRSELPPSSLTSDRVCWKWGAEPHGCVDDMRPPTMAIRCWWP
mmetsp:Transcript_2720/g.6135  ORF Transcript_2720/g.6135 Transcript_2720/m.6135 type:complete len:491 (+) Transcript_2720:1487-2959(+)